MYAGVRYKSYDTDHDSWMKLEFRSEVKVEYYSYISWYVDGIICIHHDPDDVLIKLNCYVPEKHSSVSRSYMYLGTILMHMQLHNFQ